MNDITKFSDDDVRQIWLHDQNKSQIIRDMYLETIDGIEQELKRVQDYLCDFSQRSSTVMTVAGLLGLLPALIQPIEGYLDYFLTWTFPFLIGAIVLFYFSSIRINFVFQYIPVYASKTLDELLGLRNKTVVLNDLYGRSYEQYNKTLKRYRITNALIYTYIFSFVINFYIFTFINEPNLGQSIYILIISFLLGISIIVIGNILSKKGLSYPPLKNTTSIQEYEPVKYEFGIGGPIDN